MKTNLFVYRDKEIWLKTEILSEHGKILYVENLMKLYEHESELNRGRFVNFIKKEQEYKISMFLESSSREFSCKWTSSLVEWIAENNKEPWSIKRQIDDNIFTFPDIILDFSFANSTTAVAFALVWK